MRIGPGSWARVTVGESGELTQLTDVSKSHEFARQDRPLGLVRYQTLVLDDFNKWHKEYIVGATNTNASGSNEYGKPASMMSAQPTPTHMLEAPSLGAVWIKNDTELLVETRMPDTLHEQYGAPSTVIFRYDFSSPGVVQVKLQLVSVALCMLGSS